jgi:outer membrane biosynthesis protein TonB
MAEIALRNDEKIGLAAAVLLHAALVGVLALQTARSEVSVFPERMTVSLATEVGLEAASPDPVAESRASIAPTLADDPAPVPPAPAPAAERVPSPPPPRPQPTVAPRPAPVPPPRPQATAAPRPAPSPTQAAPARERSRPDRTAAAQPATPTPASRPATSPAQAAPKSGGSRIGDDFLEGKGSSTTTNETRAPAATFGRAERAALSSAITRQLRPHWTAPSGLDAEQLISTVTWELNPDGTLRGTPRCRTDPASITDSNRPQASLHCERAIRAVQRAVPFNLPDQFYDRWKALEWQFDRRL